MIYHHVVRLHISVHYAFAMAKVQSFQKLKDIESNIIVDEARVQGSEIGIVNILTGSEGS